MSPPPCWRAFCGRAERVFGAAQRFVRAPRGRAHASKGRRPGPPARARFLDRRAAPPDQARQAVIAGPVRDLGARCRARNVIRMRGPARDSRPGRAARGGAGPHGLRRRIRWQRVAGPSAPILPAGAAERSAAARRAAARRGRGWGPRFSLPGRRADPVGGRAGIRLPGIRV